MAAKNTPARGSHAGLSWEVEFDPKTGVLSATSSGVLTPATLDEFTRFSLQQAAKHEPRGFLVDHTASSTKMTATDLFAGPERAEALGVQRSPPVAFLLSPELAAREGQFIENTFVNRGFNYQLVRSREEGMRWLLERLEEMDDA